MLLAQGIRGISYETLAPENIVTSGVRPESRSPVRALRSSVFRLPRKWSAKYRLLSTRHNSTVIARLTGSVRQPSRMMTWDWVSAKPPRYSPNDQRSTFSLRKVRRSKYLGYRFGYRRQFALISANYAKLQVGMGLAGSLTTLDYAYLS